MGNRQTGSVATVCATATQCGWGFKTPIQPLRCLILYPGWPYKVRRNGPPGWLSDPERRDDWKRTLTANEGLGRYRIRK